MSDDDLEPFGEYLRERGVTEATIGLYVAHARRALAAGGFLRRLRDPTLAPKSLQAIKAAARHYARFAEDKRLLDQLDVVRLPPARRQSARVPLERAQLDDFLAELRRTEDVPGAVVAVIGLMASRGLRLGDVLRLRRDEVVAALDTGVLAYQAKGRRRLQFRVLRTYRRWLEQLLACGDSWVTVADLVSPGSRASPRNAAAKVVERHLTRLAVRCGIAGMHAHRMRRTYAVCYLRELRGDPEALPKLQQHMGWATMATALEYVDHARGAELDDVAERMLGDA